jgi:hypothetical protein
MDGVLPGERRPITLTNLPPGLVGTLGVRLEDAENDIVQARTTEGITEFAVGNYRVWVTFPNTRGYYYVIADDEGVEATEEFKVTTDLVALTPGPLNFVPTVDEVAAHIPARTKDKFGNEVGTFNGDTRPTAVQVQEQISKGVRKVASHIGISICEGEDPDGQQSLYDDARDLAALYVAMRIELRYFPEQVGTGRSPYAQMREDWKEGKATLIEAVSEHCGGGGGESVGGAGPMPNSNFPAPSGIGEACW